MDKRKIKKIIKTVSEKTTLGTLTASIFISSCTGYNIENNLYGEFARNGIKGINGIDIDESSLSDELLLRIKQMKIIINDILTNAESATLFCNDPNEYLAEKNYDFNITLTENEIGYIRALLDPDIIQTLLENDQERFLNICIEKGYINPNIRYTDEEVRSWFRTEKDYLHYLEIMYGAAGPPGSGMPGSGMPGSGMPGSGMPGSGMPGSGMPGSGDTNPPGHPGIVFYIPAIAVAFGLLDVAIISLLFFWIDVKADINAMPEPEGRPGVRSISLINENPALKLWFDEDSKITDYNIIQDEYFSQITDQWIDYACSINNTIDKEKLKEFIINNLSNYYANR